MILLSFCFSNSTKHLLKYAPNLVSFFLSILTVTPTQIQFSTTINYFTIILFGSYSVPQYVQVMGTNGVKEKIDQ